MQEEKPAAEKSNEAKLGIITTETRKRIYRLRLEVKPKAVSLKGNTGP